MGKPTADHECILCGQPAPDYTTSVLINKGRQYFGHTVVNVHIECLLTITHGTFCQLDDLPKLKYNSAFLEGIRQWDDGICLEHFINDEQRFRKHFPHLVNEIWQLHDLLKKAGADVLISRSCWLGTYRPVDRLAKLRQQWQELIARKPHLAYVQATFDLSS
jgi:hypothetical protein